MADCTTPYSRIRLNISRLCQHWTPRPLAGCLRDEPQHNTTVQRMADEVWVQEYEKGVGGDENKYNPNACQRQENLYLKS